MKKTRIHSIPAVLNSSIAFDDLYDEISSDWQHKAETLQVRRWRKLRHEIRGSTH